jgi:site-specific DNA-methyltransferase (adenine-specific)
MLQQVSEIEKSSSACQGRIIGEVHGQKVILDDCVQAMAKLKPESIDVVVTSPPYNIGISYNTYNDKKTKNEYLSWLEIVSINLYRVLDKNGSIFLNVGSTNVNPWVSLDVANLFRDSFVLQNNFTWVKSISIGEDSVGHFKPISGSRFLNNNHESIFHFTKSGSVQLDRLEIGVPFKDKSNIARWGHQRDKRCAGNVWFLPYQTVKSKAQKFNHPAGFPVSLPDRCIRLHGKKGASVLDPFLGTGSTLVAAQKLGCKGIGIEIDPYYAESAVERLRAS